jgi:hypothetical protein
LHMLAYVYACMQVVLAVQREMFTLTFDIKRQKYTKKTIRIIRNGRQQDQIFRQCSTSILDSVCVCMCDRKQCMYTGGKNTATLNISLG